jgi:hypothetical protein
MRDLTKSMMGFSWAMSMFGLKQALAMLNPQSTGNAASSFEEVTRAAESQLGSVTRSTFQAGDRLQRGMLDMAFSLFGWGSWNPNEMMRMGTDAVQRTAQAGVEVMQQSAQAVGQMMPGGGGSGWNTARPGGGWGGAGTPPGSGWGSAGPQPGSGWPAGSPDGTPSSTTQQSGWGPMPQQDCGCRNP